MDVFVTGNAAKQYCLGWIKDNISDSGAPFSILDLGCGTALGFVSFLESHPEAHYTGVEPSTSACSQARRNLQGLNATVVNSDAYDLYWKLKAKFDFVVSFSALEHVYKRDRYLRSAKDCLKDSGYFLLNYDSGHFRGGKEGLKNLVGPILARFRIERYYQSFVREKMFRELIERVGFAIIDEKSFNIGGHKGISKLVAETSRERYMTKWLDFELYLNELGIVYDDSKARLFGTRNFILTHR